MSGSEAAPGQDPEPDQGPGSAPGTGSRLPPGHPRAGSRLPPGLPRVVLVTGTDTGVGKTVVTAALAVCLGRFGRVAVFKPAQTGVGAGEPGDADEVRRLSGLESVHEGVRLRDPLAPTTAARREHRAVPSVADHADTVRRLGQAHDVVIVEGAGGLLVGLDAAGAGLAELTANLPTPAGFVVVTRPGLGTLNHTALTTQAIRQRGLSALGLVIGAWPARPDLAEECNLTDLPAFTGIPLMGRLPEGAGVLKTGEFVASAPAWLAPALGGDLRT